MLLASLRLVEEYTDHFKVAIHAFPKTDSMKRRTMPQEVGGRQQLEVAARGIAAAAAAVGADAVKAHSGPQGRMPERARDEKHAAYIAAAKPAVALTAGLRIYAMQTAGAGSGAGTGGR